MAPSRPGGVSIRHRAGSTPPLSAPTARASRRCCAPSRGLAPVKSGSILLEARDITKLPASRRARLGIAHAMEGRRLFTQLTVADNLKLAWHFGQRGALRGEGHAGGLRPLPDPGGEDAHAGRLAERRPAADAHPLAAHDPLTALPACSTSPRSGLHRSSSRRSTSSSPATRATPAPPSSSPSRWPTLALKVSDHGYVLRRGRVVIQGKSKELLAADGATGTLSSTYL